MGFAENTPTAPNGNRKPAKAGFSCVFQGTKSRQKPAFDGSASNLRVGPPESTEAGLPASVGVFLTEKEAS